MAQISGNTCNIVTITPMSVECSVTNASSENTQDGSITLIINGGTAPYSVSWNNGQQGITLNNLSSGTYSATVTDYYGDYTITTECVVGNQSFFLDKFIKCKDSYNPNVFIFYDGTSLSLSNLTTVSENIRSWYQQEVIGGFGGQLYEGVIGNENSNGENWLWWSLYPYLGSLTGGTLSDSTVIKSFGLQGESVDNSIYDSQWCQSDDSGKCVPNNPSFNFGTSVAGGIVSDIYKRINYGYNLTGPYGVNDSRTNGVPFTITPNMDGNNSTVYGDFEGGQMEYVVVIVTDESNGQIGFYHGNTPINGSEPQKSFLFTNPFELYGTGWDNQTLKEPTNRFSDEYEKFLKVWEDIKSQNGRFNGLLYPLITNSVNQIPFLQHAVASIEGETISNGEFEDKYGTNIQNVGSQSLNLLALESENVYSTLTATTAYSSLDTQYKNGAGLKNFGWEVEPTATQNNVNTKIENFFDGTALSNTELYTNELTNLTVDKIYSLSNIEGCYSYDSRILYTGQSYETTTIVSEYNDCINCDPSPLNPIIQPKLCLSSNSSQYTFTQNGIDGNGNFVWVNSDNSLTASYNTTNDRWEITPWSNVGIGNLIQNSNNQIPTGLWVNIGVDRPLSWTMTEGECQGIPLTLNANVTNETCEGDNNGNVLLTTNGGTPPFVYRVYNVLPYPAYSNSGLFINLQPDTYTAEVSGSTGTVTTSFTIGEGATANQYTLSTPFQPISENYGSLNWTYSIQINPPLPSNVTATFDLGLTHQRISRSSGDAIFNQSHQIIKNGTLNIPYTSTSPVTSTTLICSNTVTQSNETFTQLATNVQMTGGDTIVGNVTQTVIVDGSGAPCFPEDCKMLGEYITGIQVTNISLQGGTNCDSISYPIPISGINVIQYACAT